MNTRLPCSRGETTYIGVKYDAFFIYFELVLGDFLGGIWDFRGGKSLPQEMMELTLC